jgi:hypothetical protein
MKIFCFLRQGLKLVIFLPQPPERWDYRYVPTYLTAGESKKHNSDEEKKSPSEKLEMLYSGHKVFPSNRYYNSHCAFIYLFSVRLGFEHGFPTCKADALPLEPHLLSILLWLFCFFFFFFFNVLSF